MFDLNVNETVPEKIKALKGEKEFVLIMLSFLMILLKKEIQSYIIEGYTKQYGK
jgi:hypothetical protein